MPRFNSGTCLFFLPLRPFLFSQLHLRPVFGRSASGNLFKLGNEMRHAIIPRLVSYLRYVHPRINQQLARMFDAYFRKAPENALVCAPLEIPAQCCGILPDIFRYLLQRYLFLEMVIKIRVYLVDRLFHVRNVIGAVVCRAGKQFHMPAAVQPFEHTEQADKARGVSARVKCFHHLQHFGKQPFVIKPESVLALLQQVINKPVIRQLSHIPGKHIRPELYGFAGTPLVFLIPYRGRTQLGIAQMQMRHIAPDESHVARLVV